MTNTETPARTSAAREAARHDRVRARAAAIDAHADGVVPPGRNPITGAPTASVPAWTLANAIDGAAGFLALGQMAEQREKLQRLLGEAPQGSDSRTLTDHEARGLAFEALAALDRVADKRRSVGDYRPSYMHIIDGCYPVGPYVSDAVRWVLAGGNGPRSAAIEHTHTDRLIVDAWAAMFNVATR